MAKSKGQEWAEEFGTAHEGRPDNLDPYREAMDDGEMVVIDRSVDPPRLVYSDHPSVLMPGTGPEDDTAPY